MSDSIECHYRSQGCVQEPSEDMPALRSFFQNTWNAQRSQLPVVGPKPQPTAVDGELQRAIPALHGNKATQQSSVNGVSGQMPRQSASLPSGWHGPQVEALSEFPPPLPCPLKAFHQSYSCICLSLILWNNGLLQTHVSIYL